MSQEQYDQVYDDFVTKVFGSFNLAQRHELLPAFETALNHLLSPPQPTQQQHQRKQSTNGTNAIGTSGDVNDTAKLKKQVEDLEMAIGDRMQQSGYHRSIFQRYDPTHSHSISPQHFLAVCQSQLGIGLYPHELSAFVQKYDTEGNGQINYEDLLKVIEARRSQPRTTAQDASNHALLSRSVPSYDTSAIVASVETPLSQRLEKGLDAMRQTMYMKSSNFHKLFQTLQNDNKKVPVADVLPQMSKLGFPSNLLSESELEQSLSSAAQTEPGYLSYAEFLSFFMGHKNTTSNNTSASAVQSYQPALVATLVKINNLNLRKVFKALDEDNDGLITTRELSRGLIENGFPAGGASDPSFLEYLHTFSKRQQGTFGYAEFIKFISHRAGGAGATKLDGRPINARPPIILPEDADINRIFDTIVTTRKQQGVAAESVESAWTLIDADDDGKVNEIEFFQGIAELGFQITHAQNQALFAAFDNGDGTVTIAEFARTLANPHRNARLSTSVRHAPGGESTINLGTFVSPDAGIREAASQRRVSLKQVDTPHRAAHFTSVGVADSDVNEDLKGHGRKQSQEDSNREKISLSFDVTPADARLPRPSSRHNLEGTSDASAPDAKLPTIPEPYQRIRQPPGGASSINFSTDHGAPVVQPPRQSSKLDLLSFDPNAPVAAAQHVLRPPTAGQGRATISLAHVDEQPTTGERPKTPAGPSTPSNRSSVSFNQTDSESYRPLVTQLRATGGESSIQLSHPENIPPSPSSYQTRPQDKINVTLSHPENQNEYAPIQSPTRARKSVDNAPTSTLKLSHDSSRNDDDLAYAAPQHRTRQHIESPTKSTLSLGMDTPDVSQYKNDVGTGEIDTNLLATITKAIYAHSQRLRHTFQEFNHSQSSTLSKTNFKNGITNILKIQIPDNQVDILYSRFDGDLDGEITYSEFVRMLATK